MDVLRFLVLSLSHRLIFAALHNSSETASNDCSRVYFPQSSGTVQSYNFPFHYTQHLECSHIIMASHIFPKPCEICFTFSAFHTVREGDCLEIYDGLTKKYIYDGYGFLKTTETVTGDKREEASLEQTPVRRNHLWYRNFCWPLHQEYFQLIFRTSNGSLSFTNPHNSQIGRFYASYHISSTDTNITEDSDDNGTLVNNAGLLPPNISIHTTERDQVPCKHNMWPCFNRQCIPGDKVCNSVDDCGDRSDESYKHTLQCGIGGFSACDLSDNLAPAQPCYSSLQGSQFERRSERLHAYRGPTRDHTQSFGHIVQTNAFIAAYFTDETSTSEYAELRDIAMPVLDPTKDYCFSFWYHMYGPDPGHLYVYTESLLEQPLWIRHGNYQDIWHHGEVSLQPTMNLSQAEKLLFRAMMGSDVKAVVAVDDFHLYEGSCLGDDISCTYELSFCSWEAIETGLHAPFIRSQGPGPHGFGPNGDQSSHDNGGFYLYAFHGAQLWRFTASLLSPPLTIFDGDTIDGCLTFWYFCNGTDSLIFEWYSIDSRGNEIQQGTTRLRARNAWTLVEQNVWSSQPIKIRMAFTDNGLLNSAAVAVDTISVLPGHCNDYVFGSCKLGDFRCWNGQCIPNYWACDGKEDCSDGSDERNETCCQCSPGYFCCRDWNSTCINETLVCDGFSDCPSGADESPGLCRRYYRGVPIGIVVAILMIGGVALAVIVIVLVKCIKWIIKQDCTQTSRRGNTQDASNDIEIGTLSETAWDSPPTYADAVDNPAYKPPPWKETGKKSSVSPPPEYDKILSGEFTELFWPTKAELEQLRLDTLQQYGVSQQEAYQPHEDEPEEREHVRGKDDPPSRSVAMRSSPTTTASSSCQAPPRTAIVVDKEAIRRVLKGSFRKRTPANQARIGPMITIKIYTGGSNNQNSPRNAPITSDNPAFVDTEQPSSSRENTDVHVSQAEVDIQVVAQNTADFPEVTVDSRSSNEQGYVNVTSNLSPASCNSSTALESLGNGPVNPSDMADASLSLESNANDNTNNNASHNMRSTASTLSRTASSEGTEPAIPNISL